MLMDIRDYVDSVLQSQSARLNPSASKKAVDINKNLESVVRDLLSKGAKAVDTVSNAFPPSVDISPGPVDNLAFMGLAGVNRGLKNLLHSGDDVERLAGQVVKNTVPLTDDFDTAVDISRRAGEATQAPLDDIMKAMDTIKAEKVRQMTPQELERVKNIDRAIDLIQPRVAAETEDARYIQNAQGRLAGSTKLPTQTGVAIKPNLKKTISPDGTQFYDITKSGKNVGQIETQKGTFGNDDTLINYVEVGKESQRQGIATDALRKIAKDSGSKTISAEPTNLAAYKALKKAYGNPIEISDNITTLTEKDILKRLPQTAKYLGNGDLDSGNRIFVRFANKPSLPTQTGEKMTAYRGGSESSAKAIEAGKFHAPQNEPMWFSKTQQGAERYGTKITQADLGNLKLLDTSELQGTKIANSIAQRAGLGERYSIKDPKFAKQLVKEGYDGLVMGNGNDFAILNRSAKIQSSSLPTQVEGLAKEASKYKSAEEFVKAQPTVYHGSANEIKRFHNKSGVFFADNYADASGFGGNPDHVYEGVLNFKKPLVIDAKGAKWDELNTKFGKSTQEVISNAQGKGYDGVTFKNIVDNVGDTADWGGTSTIHYAYKPKDAFLNQSQLTDIFNQSKGVQNKGGAK